MHFASFQALDGSPTWGVPADGHAYDLGPSGLGLAPGLKAAIADDLLAAAAERHRDAPTRPEVDVTFLPAVRDPAKILCVGVNYRDHQEETGHTGMAPRRSSRGSWTPRPDTCGPP